MNLEIKKYKDLLKNQLTPKEIVEKLDQYIIGQNNAKKAVAIALRNRARRKLVDESLRSEIYPKNILMIGNTGIGKTEIARRLAKLSDAPFIKVEATKFTEVGYVGRDVESIIRDLLNVAINDGRAKMLSEVEVEATNKTEARILDILLPSKNIPVPMGAVSEGNSTKDEELERFAQTRKKMKKKLENGEFDNKEIEIDIPQVAPDVGMMGVAGSEDMQNMGGMIKNIMQMLPMGKQTAKRKVTVEQARKILKQQIAESLIDQEKVVQQAIEKTENMGIVFLDEIDKVVKKGGGSGIDVSREGVQRDILPLVEGSVVTTRYGTVNTDHILFIAAGAFHISSPSDIIPELQGRFPIRVELESLGQEEMERILKEPKNSLLKQYKALLGTEGVDLEFTAKAIKEIARISCEVNEKTHDIGARRLSTVLEKLLEEFLFSTTKSGKKIKIDEKKVGECLNEIVENEDLSRYIL